MSALETWRKRRAIFAALKISPMDRHAQAAIEPFTVLETDNGNWIAGAIGHEQGNRYGDWHPTGDVILWNPRTNALALRSDPGPALIIPLNPDPRLIVYADGFAFFRAWADNRAAIAERTHAAEETHRTTHSEPKDSGIPGALAIGDLAKLDWCSTDATVLVAGPGIDPKQLNRAIIRSARLPRVESLAA